MATQHEIIYNYLKTTDMTKTKQTSSPGVGQAYLTEHPEGHIRLMDNSLLKVYETAEPHKGFDREQVGEVFAFFQKHLPLFWKHRHRILSDSRMFLTPIPSVSGLAYFGRLPDTTLGTYLELWSICEPAVTRDKEGVRHFVTIVAGSPLSGRNCCTLVSEGGKITRSVHLNSFGQVWSEFANLIGRYKGLEKVYDSYSLEELVRHLQPKQNTGLETPKEVHAVLTPTERYDAVKTAYAHKVLTHEWKILQQQYDKAITLLHRYVVAAHKEEFTKIYQEHRCLCEAWEKREVELADERKAIRYRLRHGEANSRELQLRLKAIRREKEEWNTKLGGGYWKQVRDVFPDFPIPTERLGKLLGLE